MDFAGDLAKMLRLTGMTAEVMTADVPLSEAARKILRDAPSLLETILTGGDDYEILCAVPPPRGAAFEAERHCRGDHGAQDRRGIARRCAAGVQR